MTLHFCFIYVQESCSSKQNLNTVDQSLIKLKETLCELSIEQLIFSYVFTIRRINYSLRGLTFQFFLNNVLSAEEKTPPGEKRLNVQLTKF